MGVLPQEVSSAYKQKGDGMNLYDFIIKLIETIFVGAGAVGLTYLVIRLGLDKKGDKK